MEPTYGRNCVEDFMAGFICLPAGIGTVVFRMEKTKCLTKGVVRKNAFAGNTRMKLEVTMDITLKNLLLAGIGSMATTYEKAEDIVGELVKKGELTVKNGKELNEELKKRIDKCRTEDVPHSIEHLKAVLAGMNFATKKDIDELKQRIDELEKNKIDS